MHTAPVIEAASPIGSPMGASSPTWPRDRLGCGKGSGGSASGFGATVSECIADIGAGVGIEGMCGNMGDADTGDV
ncbi:MAG: hypothetical protein ACK5KS_06480 [Planctomyces sp.]